MQTFRYGEYKELKEAYDAAQDVIDGKLVFLTLASGVDRGKSHLAIAICRAWLASGRTAKYAFVPLLLDELRAGFNLDGDNSYNSRLNFYMKVSLLVLDDLGAGKQTDWAIEKLESIVDYRYIHGLVTVITTNCQPKELSPRIRSRIQRANNSRIVSIIKAPEARTWLKLIRADHAQQ